MKWTVAAGLALAIFSVAVAFSARPAKADSFPVDCVLSPIFGPIQTIVLSDGTITVAPCIPETFDQLFIGGGCLPRNVLIITVEDGVLVQEQVQVPWHRVCRSVAIGPTNGFANWFRSREPWCICRLDYQAHRANQLLNAGHSREFLRIVQTTDANFSDAHILSWQARGQR